MAYKQIVSFDVQRMGTRKGYCEQNCREGFGITKGMFPSAKADMEWQKKQGTFHTTDLPSNVAVPVFFDTASQYEHVMVDDHTRFYSDGKYVSDLKGWKILGWGEFMDGVRVVEYVPDPAPTPTPTGFLPAKGFWAKGDKDARIGKLASFMRANYPRYTKACALGNYYGVCIESSIRQFQTRTGLVADGRVGKLTYGKLREKGFKG